MTAPDKSLPAHRILYIDDDLAFAILFKHMLERLGHRVSTESSAGVALERLSRRRDHFDLVVTDYRMPELNGVAVATMIRARHPGLACAVVTSHLSSDVIEAASAAGVSLLFEKPFNSMECEELIRRCAA